MSRFFAFALLLLSCVARAVPAAALASGTAREENSPRAEEGPAALAIAARDQNDPAQAAALWEKAVELAPTDGFLIEQKAWSYLALGRLKDAKKTFARAAEFSPETAGVAESQFGLGLTQYLDSDFKTAAKTLESVCQQSPFLYPVASAWLAKVAVRMGKPDVASLYLRHSLDQDPLHPSALDSLGELYQSHKMAAEARQCFGQALAVNVSDSRAKDGLRKAEEQLGESAAAAANRRISAPLLQRPSPPPPSPSLRIGLFSNPEGEPVGIKKIHFASGAEARLVKDGKELAGTAANQRWEASWDMESRVLEVRDAGRKLRYAGRDVVRFEPREAGASVLLQGVELADPRGIDTGDRELRGAVELRPAASGFFMINELGIEEYLFSQLGALSPAGAPESALKAEAVVLRTAMESARKKAKPAAGFDLCDSSRCQPYLGLGHERSESTAAVLATAGQILSDANGAVNAAFHAHCGGMTEEGIVETIPIAIDAVSVASGTVAVSSAAAQAAMDARPVRTTEALERFLHADPPKELFCNISQYPPANWERWVRILEPRQIEEAVFAGKPIGALRAIKTLSRSATGRLTGLELEGDSGKWSVAGEEELGHFLSRLGLRSALVSFQPIYRDKNIELVLAWGAGSGSGHGLCVAGALGQASQGKDYKEILKHYFPGAEIR